LIGNGKRLHEIWSLFFYFPLKLIALTLAYLIKLYE